MGRARRWLKGLFGITTKEKHEMEYSVQSKDNRRWSSGPLSRNAAVPCHNPTTTIIPPNIAPAEAAWLRSFYSEPDDEQKQHARAVAAATAAAADAAVTAARAAVAVVRLTGQGRLCRKTWAAAKIQAAFRGYLARKALRALKGLVKIQALVRGFLVRKQAAVALHSMQALVRAQQSVRALRTRTFINDDQNFSPQFRSRKSLENYQTASSSDSRRVSRSSFDAFDESPKIVEVDTGCGPKSRSKRPNTWLSDPPANAIISTPESKNLAEQAMNACAKSCLSGCAEYPNYLVLSRQSFRGKQRSQSAPKQRPEPGPNRRLSLLELMESRNGPSRVRMARAQEAIDFKSAVMWKLGRSPNFVQQRD